MSTQPHWLQCTVCATVSKPCPEDYSSCSSCPSFSRTDHRRPKCPTMSSILKWFLEVWMWPRGPNKSNWNVKLETLLDTFSGPKMDSCWVRTVLELFLLYFQSLKLSLRSATNNQYKHTCSSFASFSLSITLVSCSRTFSEPCYVATFRVIFLHSDRKKNLFSPLFSITCLFCSLEHSIIEFRYATEIYSRTVLELFLSYPSYTISNFHFYEFQIFSRDLFVLKIRSSDRKSENFDFLKKI